MSVTSKGVQGPNGSEHPTISDDGRYAAFDSYSDLAQTGQNLFRHVYIKDTLTGAVRRVSENAKGEQGDGESFAPSLSADGRYVAFSSRATNLATTKDTNGKIDIFVKDMATGSVQRVSVSPSGEEANGDSGLLQFSPDHSGVSISDDGKLIAFVSEASNLVAGDTNNARDIFVRNLSNGVLLRVSTNAQGEASNADSFFPAINGRGTTVAFTSFGSNLIPGFASGFQDIYVKDLISGSLQRVSSGPKGELPNANSGAADLSADGRVVVFDSFATNMTEGPVGLSEIYRRELPNGAPVRISVSRDGAVGDNNSFFPKVTADGRYVVFASSAANLLPLNHGLNSDIFLKDMQTGAVSWLSTPPDIKPTNGNSIWPSISGTGRIVVFTSSASNLVTGDTNNVFDIFLAGTGLGIGVANSGDITGDGIIDVRDAIRALNVIVGLFPARQDEITAGDMDKNGKLNALDVVGILRKVAGTT